MARERVYGSDAERVQAWRERKRETEREQEREAAAVAARERQAREEEIREAHSLIRDALEALIIKGRLTKTGEEETLRLIRVLRYADPRPASVQSR